MTRVHIAEVEQYEGILYSIHAEEECDPKYHPPYVESEMPENVLGLMLATEAAYARMQGILGELFDTGEHIPGT